MLKLIIKEKGMFINIPGVAEFRTPAEIDISKLNINSVISELKKNGINKYQIISGEIKKIENKTVKKNIVIKEKIISNNQNVLLDKIESQQKTINRIENILTQFLNSDKSISTELNKTIKKKRLIEDEIEEFIPEVNFNNLKIKGSTKK